MSKYKTFIRNCFFVVAVSGCTYETTYEEVEFVQDAGDAMIQNSERNAGSGALDADKIRGIETPMTIGVNGVQKSLNYTLDEPAQTTIQIGIEQAPGAYKDNGPPNLRAMITWNTSGVGTNREVSVGNGTSVTGSCENVAVSLQDWSGAPIDPDEAGYKVTVAAVPGSRGSTATPPTLIPLISDATYSPAQTLELPPFPGSYSLVAGGAVSIAVPKNVGIQSLYVTEGTYAAVSGYGPKVTNLAVYQVDAAAAVIKKYYASMSDGFVPMSPQCSAVILSVEIEAEVSPNGTSDFTHASTAVVGTGTAYTTELQVGWFVKAVADPNADYAQIKSIADDTHLTLVGAYAGTGGVAVPLVYTENTSSVLSASVAFGIDG